MGSVYARDVFVEVFDRVRATDAKTRSKPRRPTLRLCAPCENHAECGTHFPGIARRKLRSREARHPPFPGHEGFERFTSHLSPFFGRFRGGGAFTRSVMH